MGDLGLLLKEAPLLKPQKTAKAVKSGSHWHAMEFSRTRTSRRPRRDRALTTHGRRAWTSRSAIPGAVVIDTTVPGRPASRVCTESGSLRPGMTVRAVDGLSVVGCKYTPQSAPQLEDSQRRF